MLTAHNQKLYNAGKKRRAMFLKLSTSGLSNTDLSLKFGLSRERISKILQQARIESGQIVKKGARGLT